MLKKIWRMPPWRKEAETRVHQRLNSAMGMVPVAPRRKRLLPPGDRKVSGFADRPTAEELKRIERM